jgi:hypothetical protein
VETALIADAQRHFAEAVAVVLRNERGQSDVLRELELELAKSAFRSPGDARLGRTDARLEPWSSWADALIRIANWDPADPNRHAELNQEAIRDKSIPTQYGIGRSALNRLYAQEVATGSWQSQADALVQIADWDLVHSRNSIALSEYELLYVKLQDMGVAQGAIDEIFSPTVPVVLPRLIPDPLTSTAPQGSGGFVDVAFEITRFGESRDVEVLDSSPEVTPSSVRNIVNTIQGSNFRPRTTNGRFSRSSSVTVRYFLNDPN